MNKILNIAIALALLIGISGLAISIYQGVQNKVITNLGGSFAEKNYASATTTAWSIGPQESKTVLAAKGNRGCIILSNNGPRDVYYRLDSTSATSSTGILLTASSTVYITETLPYRGAVTAMSAVASTTLLVTECLY